ncbi:MAG: protein kinase [Fuerstiella sp.]
MTGHPDLRQLAAFLDGRLSERDREVVEQHVAACDSCCEIMAKIPQDTLSAQLQDVETGVADTFVAGPLAAGSSDSASDIPRELVDHPRYRILEPLGRGGMGIVYKAQHRMMDRIVALKVIDGRLIENPEAIVRFRNEVKAAARLSHANIVRAFDAEQEGNLHFLVMEFVDGISLSELVRRKGPLPVDQACGVVRKVAHALQHAFRQGMVHRDIKPQNIMVTQDGRVRVLDFGLARLVRESETHITDGHDPSTQMRRTADALTMVGSVLGTPDYIAPEQVTDAHLADTKSDLYSLGCTFYFLLTGQPPYPDGTAMQKLAAHTGGAPTPVTTLRPEIPPAIADLVQRMMAKKPADRLQTPIEVVDAIEALTRQAEQAATATQTRSVADTAGREKSPPAASRAAAPAPPKVNVPKKLSDAEPFKESGRNPGEKALPVRRRYRRSTRPWKTWLWPSIVLTAAVAVVVGLITSGGNEDHVTDPGAAGNSPAEATVHDGFTTDNDGWIDLLAGVDPAAHSEGGYWTRTESGLTAASAMYAKLRLMSDVPGEYDLEVSFTRVTGKHSIALIFTAGEHQATFEVDAWEQHLAGIQNINGHDLQSSENPARVTNLALVNGQPCTASVKVRRDRVEAWLNGTLLTTYRGNGASLSPLPDWALTAPTSIGVGAYLSETVFHRIRLRPVNNTAP